MNSKCPHPSFTYLFIKEGWGYLNSWWWLQTLRAVRYYVKVEKHTSIWSIVTVVLHPLLVLMFIYCRCKNLWTKPDNCTHIMLHKGMNVKQLNKWTDDFVWCAILTCCHMLENVYFLIGSVQFFKNKGDKLFEHRINIKVLVKVEKYATDIYQM